MAALQEYDGKPNTLMNNIIVDHKCVYIGVKKVHVSLHSSKSHAEGAAQFPMQIAL
jgi:hypothetical protein